MTTIRQDIEKASELQKVLKPPKIYRKAGLHIEEGPSGNSVFYCPTCKSPVVDSQRGRQVHVQISERCRQAMGII